MFEKSLQDLVKGIRNTKGDSVAYIQKAIAEIKDEVKSRDVTLKAQALQKMTYLHMLGYDMSWASFAIIETMSQERFGLKRIGFLAAAQSFTQKTDVLVLCTQLLKKEFQAKSPFEIGTAINCLANIATEDLARDLLGDVVTMLTSSRPYIRKKATLVLYKLYVAYPQGLRLTFDHLKRRLTDEAPAIVSCAVNVICELARKKPSNYLILAPDLFELLTKSTNNWMLIKVAKLMSALVQEEPRLARKLLEPLATIVQTTGAKSLMFECISTITYALQYTKKPDGSDAKNAPAVVRLCTDRLREMVRDPDANLKYLGLTGLTSLMRSNPKVVAEHRELVLECLVDEDVTIRLRALDLITGMVTRRNLPEIVKRLLELLEAAEGHFRDELIGKIIFMASRDKYAYCADFAWYVSVLAKLAYLPDTRHTVTVAGQLLDVAVRVADVRPFAVQTLLPMLADPILATNARKEATAAAAAAAAVRKDATPAPGSAEAEAAVVAAAAAAAASDAPSSTSSVDGLGCGYVLYASAWIVGEFCSVIPPAMHSAVIDALLQPGALTLPPAVQGVYVQCALKVLAASAAAAATSAAKGRDRAGSSVGTAAASDFLALASSVVDRLDAFARSVHVEVQERACLTQHLLASLGVPFTPAPEVAARAVTTAAAEAAAAAEAGGAPAAPSTAPTRSPQSLAPAAADVRLISQVLAALFAEALRPVNPKAQRKVAVPEGLNLDAWINPGEEAEAAKDAAREAKAARKLEKAGGTVPAFSYENISFEDSYGVTDEEFAGAGDASDSDDGGKKKKKGSKKGKKDGKKGDSKYDVGAADSDDDAWMDGIKKANAAREEEMFGKKGGSKEDEEGGKKGKKDKKDKKKSKKGEEAAEEDGGHQASRGGGSSRDAMRGTKDERMDVKDRDADDTAADLADQAQALKKKLDVSIFGDFGGGSKPAAAKEASGKKASKKDKKGSKKKGGLLDSDDDAPAASSAAAAASKVYRVADDDDMPEGAGDDDEGAGSDTDGVADALAGIDLSTPLGDDEVLPSQQHRRLNDPVALAGGGTKGRGRARNLHGAPSAPAAPAPKEEEGKKGKKDKKDKKEEPEAKSTSKEKGDKKGSSSKDAAKPEKEGKDGKKKKAAEVEEEAPAKKSSSKKDKKAEAAPAPAPAAEEPKKAKKDKKSSKTDKEEAAAPAPAAAPAAEPEPVVEAPPPPPPFGEACACEAPFAFPLAHDKVLRFSFTVSTAPATPSPFFGPAGEAPAGSPAGIATVTIKVKPRSTRKPCDFVDATVGETTVRISGGLEAKSKDKAVDVHAVAAIALPITDPHAPLTVPIRFTYQVAGSGSLAAIEAVLRIPLGALVVPVGLDSEGYKGVMVAHGAAFAGADGVLPVPPGMDAGAAIALAAGVLRTASISRSPVHAILYGRTLGGAHVTGLLKASEDGKAVAASFKATLVPGLAAALLADVNDALASVAKEAAEAAKGDE